MIQSVAGGTGNIFQYNCRKNKLFIFIRKYESTFLRKYRYFSNFLLYLKSTAGHHESTSQFYLYWFSILLFVYTLLSTFVERLTADLIILVGSKDIYCGIGMWLKP